MIGVGDRVVCVSVSNLDDRDKPFPRLGQIYTVRETGLVSWTGNGAPCIRLEEIFRGGMPPDCPFFLSRFRKCRPTNIDFFTKIDADVFKRVNA